MLKIIGCAPRTLALALLALAALAAARTPAAAATLTATPNPVFAPSGIGTTTIIWDATDAGFGQVFVSVDSGPEVLVAAGATGSRSLPWIQTGHTYDFRLYAGAGHSSVIGLARVTTGALLYASPPSIASADGSAPTAITWDTGGGVGEVFVSLDGGQTQTLFARAPRGTAAAPWVQAGAVYTFTLSGTGIQPVSIAVRPGPRLSAAPNPVDLQGPTGTSVISWNVGTGFVNGQVWLSVNGTDEVLFAESRSGTKSAPWIAAGDYRFTLYEAAADAVHPPELRRGRPLAATTVNGGRSVPLTLVQTVLGVNQPLLLTHAGDGSGDLFVAEKPGRIRRLFGGRLTTFLDITGRVGSAGSEQGLLGVAFHPRYAFNRQVFVNYTDTAGNTVIARFTGLLDGSALVPDSEDVILRIAQPAANHNGGWLGFGPDGFLYAGLGDGGGAGDQFGNAQNPGSLLGKILRLDVDSARPYAIPLSNPFVGIAGFRGEIWALGLRQPFRPSFDRVDGHLYVADVGESAREEVNFEPLESRGGDNYGWPRMEGFACFPDASAPCDQTGLTLPVLDYPHTSGAQRECAITGGFVYRGSTIPGLRGAYIFGDFCSGRIWAMRKRVDGIFEKTQILQMPLLNDLSSFGEDEAAEVYAVGIAENTIFRIAPGAP